MFTRLLCFLAFLVYHGAQAQICTPDHVGRVVLDFNYTLYWEPSTNCEITDYIIYIHLEQDDLAYIYTTQDVYLNVSFLPACEQFHFRVVAHADNQISDEVRLSSYIPAPSGADLTITYLNASVQDATNTFLRWNVAEKFAHCARAFRVIVHDRINFPRDIYTANNFLFLNNLVPCGHYELAVMAIYNLESEGPITLIEYDAPAANATAPILENVQPNTTSVELSWRFPPYSVNRCGITALDVEGLPSFHYRYAVYDTPERPLYNISVNNLRPETMYVVRVSIINTAGSSQALPISIQTLPSLT